jgi:hypothetical protein
MAKLNDTFSDTDVIMTGNILDDISRYTDGELINCILEGYWRLNSIHSDLLFRDSRINVVKMIL